ncbi:MAG: hypothetical protein EBT49_01720 [Betaproteobacteria bacterium]|jgi:hypothetical protein|nr:hypothetical protein [Betaproteobacteria bacterium]
MNKCGIALVLGLLMQAAALAQDCEAFAHGDDRSMCAALQQKTLNPDLQRQRIQVVARPW